MCPDYPGLSAAKRVRRKPKKMGLLGQWARTFSLYLSTNGICIDLGITIDSERADARTFFVDCRAEGLFRCGLREQPVRSVSEVRWQLHRKLSSRPHHRKHPRHQLLMTIEPLNRRVRE